MWNTAWLLIYIMLFDTSHSSISFFTLTKYIFLFSIHAWWILLKELDLRATLDISIGFVSRRYSTLNRINALLSGKSTNWLIFNRIRVDVGLFSYYCWTSTINFRKFVPHFLLDSLVVPLVHQIVLYNLSLGALSNVFWTFTLTKPSLRLRLIDE